MRPGALRTPVGLREVVLRDGQLEKLPGSVKKQVGVETSPVSVQWRR